MVDRLADAINTIKTNERIGREYCKVYSTKLIRSVLDAMKRESYIEGYEEFSERHARMLKVKLTNRINNMGVIKPRLSVNAAELIERESRYIPSRDFGILIVSTPQGMMTSNELRGKNIGGKLIAYVY
ncbi:MAG: 30S ribosomal protein S8 [Candidatus Micrarchaeaceae archaeon]